MPKEKPLWEKMYFQEAYTEMTRAIGYGEVSAEQASERVRKLVERFGKEIMKAASVELVDIVEQRGTSPIVRLKPHVRKLAWQLLGFPPEHKPPVPPVLAASKEEAKPSRKKPERTKKDRGFPPFKKFVPKPRGTPMEQYRDAKERHPGMLLLFRMGDFYELFHEDAKSAAALLGLTLTTREKSTPMAGFPHHQLESYLKKLLAAGIRVAICDPVENAR